MRRVFVDTGFWVAKVNRKDVWADAAGKATESLGNTQLVTTDEVLAEFLNLLSGYGEQMRKVAVRFVRTILENPNVVVHPQTRKSFLDGLVFYEERRDKSYSLTDCISMKAMHHEGVNEVLSTDGDFQQEGFVNILQRHK